MTTIVTRAGKGFPLTWDEVDANFNNLNNDKAETTAVDLKAPLSSPTFTGTPAAPTAAVNTNTTQVATTAFVNAEIDSDRPYSNTNPVMNGTAAQGTSANLSRQDHVHPSDTSRVAKAGDTMSGNLTAPAVLVSAAQDTSINALTRKDWVEALVAEVPPQFQAGFSSTGTSNGSLLLQPSEEWDPTNVYSTGRFTPLKAGMYQFSATAQFSSTGAVTYVGLQLKRNGSIISSAFGSPYGGSLFGSATLATLIYMNGTTDYLELWQNIDVAGTPTITSLRSGCSFIG